MRFQGIPYNQDLKPKARQLRNNPTAAEKKIWNELLARDKLGGLRFLRQKPIDQYIADFYCHALLLVIEIDGGSHFTREGKEYDEQRTKALNGYGIEVIRYTNDEVLNHFSNVVDDLKKRIGNRINPQKNKSPFAKGY